MRRDELVAHLDEYLAIDALEDRSWNGLQVEGAAEVTRLAVAVDACLPTIRDAARRRCQMLLVHHGLFWGEGVRVVGVEKQRIGRLLEADISVYAAHLPLDVHPQAGNNALVLELLGIERHEPFGLHRGQLLGRRGRLARPAALSTLARQLDEALDTRSQIYAFGPRQVRTVGAITGAGGFGLVEAAQLGLDLLVTGEWDHAKHHFAKEHRVNVITAGHYKTETVGVIRVAELLEQRFGLPWVFLDHPTGL